MKRSILSDKLERSSDKKNVLKRFHCQCTLDYPELKENKSKYT